ncbi:MAG: hypothetical protein GY754_13170 [bacterium]|nr:hypothetical protein [bacterium]
MKKKFLIPVVTICMLISISCDRTDMGGVVDNLENPANMNGTWDFNISDVGSSSNSYTTKMVIEQDENDLTFTYGIDEGDSISGFVNGNSVTITSVSTKPSTYTLSGTVNSSEDQVSGTFTCTGTCDSTSGIFSMDLYSTATEVPTFTLPETAVTINIDGLISDWSGISNIVDDSTGDSSTSGSDLEFVKMAVNSAKTELYVIMKTASGDTIDTAIRYVIAFRYGDSYEKRVYAYYDSIWQVAGYDEVGETQINSSLINGMVSTSGEYIEFSVGTTAFGTPPDNFSVYIRTVAQSGGDECDSADFFGYVNVPD